MNEPPPPADPAAARVPPATRWALATVAVALAVAGIAGWMDARRSALSLRHDVARELAAANAVSAQANARVSTLASDLRDAQAKLALLDTRQTEAQTQQAALENFYRDLSPSRDELALTEVEQTLNLASQQLALAGNVQSALAALQLTDTKLARLDRPRFAPLRRALAVDMERLKAVPYVDVAGLAGKLDNAIAGAVSEYTFHGEQVAFNEGTTVADERLIAVHELRNLLKSVTLAVGIIKSGKAGLTGATAEVLDRSLVAMRELIDRLLAESAVKRGDDTVKTTV